MKRKLLLLLRKAAACIFSSSSSSSERAGNSTLFLISTRTLSRRGEASSSLTIHARIISRFFISRLGASLPALFFLVFFSSSSSSSLLLRINFNTRHKSSSSFSSSPTTTMLPPPTPLKLFLANEHPRTKFSLPIFSIVFSTPLTFSPFPLFPLSSTTSSSPSSLFSIRSNSAAAFASPAAQNVKYAHRKDAFVKRRS